MKSRTFNPTMSPRLNPSLKIMAVVKIPFSVSPVNLGVLGAKV
jgi:hypothetical protein